MAQATPGLQDMDSVELPLSALLPHFWATFDSEAVVPPSWLHQRSSKWTPCAPVGRRKSDRLSISNKSCSPWLDSTIYLSAHWLTTASPTRNLLLHLLQDHPLYSSFHNKNAPVKKNLRTGASSADAACAWLRPKASK